MENCRAGGRNPSSGSKRPFPENRQAIRQKGVFDVKKTLAMVLALAMMFALLTGCGGGSGDSGGDGSGAEYTWRMALNGSAPGELGYDMATFFK